MNNSWLKLALVFVGGMAVGALGAVALSKGKLTLRPLTRDIVAGGMELKERAAAVVEAAKEHFEDIVAEAEEIRAQKEAGKNSPASKA